VLDHADNGSLTATGRHRAPGSRPRNPARTSGKWYFERRRFVDARTAGWGHRKRSGTLSSYIAARPNGAGYQSTNSFYLNGGNPGPNLPKRGHEVLQCLAIGEVNYLAHFRQYYVELTCGAVDGSNGWMAGITNVSGPLTNFLGSDNNSAGYQSQQSFWKNGSSSSGAPTI